MTTRLTSAEVDLLGLDDELALELLGTGQSLTCFQLSHDTMSRS
jgi:hypothetical protein